MHQLSAEVIRALSSAQVITSVHSVVKELVENSLDARATNIEVKLENYGADLIEVRDDGCGIGKDDIPNMAVAHYTSKLTTLDDMKGLETYGFRGEALASLAAVSSLTITTRTKDDDLATTYTLDRSGRIAATKPSHLGVGTVVTALDLFKEVPVRRQLCRNPKHAREDFKNVQEVLMAFGIAHPKVRFVLRHGGSLVWQKALAENFRANLALVLGTEVVGHLALFTDQSFSPMVKVFGYLPKPGANRGLVARVSTDRFFQLVNRRPVFVKPIVQVIKEVFLEAFPTESACRNMCPVGVVCIELLPEDIDVNLEPNKTAVLFHDIESVTAVIRCALSHLYKATPSTEDTRKIQEPESATVSNGTPPVSRYPLNSGTPPSTLNTNFGTMVQTITTHHSTTSTTPHTSHSTLSTSRTIPVSTSTSTSTSHTTSCTNSTAAKMSNPTLQASGAHSPTQVTFTPHTSRSRTSVGGSGPSHQPPDMPTPVWAGMTSPPGSDGGVADPGLLLDVSECGDFDYISDDEGAEPWAWPTSETQAEKSALPQEQPTTAPLSPPANGMEDAIHPGGSSWSRGRGVATSDLVPVEPVRVLKPVPLEEKQAKQSKLHHRGSPAIYDLVDRRPVKRRCEGEQEVGGAPGKKRKAKKVTPRSYRLQNYIIPPVEQVNVDTDLQASKDRYLMLSHVNGEGQQGEGQKGEGVSALPSGVVGYCRPPDVWLVVVDGNIGCFDVRSVQQAMLFERLTETYELPLLALPSPLVLNEGNLGGVMNVAVLSDLNYEQNTLDGHWYCCDDRVVKNGFKIKKRLTDDGQPQLELTHCYSIASSCSDLCQLAEMIRHSKNQRLCRPSSVQCYLQSEAQRMAGGETLEKESVESLLKDTLRKSGSGGNPSLHFFYAIL